MNPGKEEEKQREGGDECEVAGRGALPASPECHCVDVSCSSLSGERIVCTGPYISSKTITLTWL